MSYWIEIKLKPLTSLKLAVDKSRAILQKTILEFAITRQDLPPNDDRKAKFHHSKLSLIQGTYSS